MALQFPINPIVNQTYSSGSSATYSWNGSFWQTTLPPTQTILFVTSASRAEMTLSSSFATTATSASALLGTTPTYIQAYNISQQSFPNLAVTTIAGWTNFSAQNAAEWNPTTGVFTATKAGTYRVSVKLLFATFAFPAGFNEMSIAIVHTSGNVAASYLFSETTTNILKSVPTVTAIVTVTPGQTFLTNCYQATGAARTLFNNVGGCSLTIEELPGKIQK